MGHERILIVIPAYNEQASIGSVISGVRSSLPAADVLVIDDGSSDATAQIASKEGATTLRLPLNLGYGAALQSGYKWAVRRGYPLVGQLDADGQHSPDYLPAMVEKLRANNTDVIVGSRFLDQDGHYRPSMARKVGVAMFSRVASVIMRQHITDPTSGLQVMRSSVAQFFCTEVYPSDYPDADMLILLHRSGFRVEEMAVQMNPSTGKSMHGGHRSLYYIYKMWLSILVTLLRRPTVPT